MVAQLSAALSLAGPDLNGLIEFIRNVGTWAGQILKAILSAYPAVGAVALVLGLLGAYLNKRSLIYIGLFFGALSIMVGAAPGWVKWAVEIGKRIFHYTP